MTNDEHAREIDRRVLTALEYATAPLTFEDLAQAAGNRDDAQTFYGRATAERWFRRVDDHSSPVALYAVTDAGTSRLGELAAVRPS